MDCEDIIMINSVLNSYNFTLLGKFSSNPEKLLSFFQFSKEEKTRHFTSLLLCNTFFFLKPCTRKH